MQRLLEKTYEISLVINKRFLFIPYTRKILLKFWEAKFIDVIEFLEKIKWDWTNIIIRLLKFIKEHTEKKLTKQDINWIMMYADKVIPKIKETFFEWCFWWEKWWEESPMSSYIAILSEKLNIHPLELMNKYTMRQLEFLTEWLVWNVNCQTKDWERKNRLWLTKQKVKTRPKEEDEKIKNILEWLKK